MSSIAHQSPVEYLTKADYGKLIGRSERVVERYIKDGRLPDATKDNRGVVIIPSNVRPLDTSPPFGVHIPMTYTPLHPLEIEPSRPPIKRTLFTLEEVAEANDTTVGGIRRMADAGLYDVGHYGRNGALRVFIP